MTDDSTPHDRDRDRDDRRDPDADGQGDSDDVDELTNGDAAGDRDVAGSADPVGADPERNGAGTERTDRSPPDDSVSDGSAPEDSAPEDSVPDPIVRDVAPDPSPDARPRDDAPQPPDEDATTAPDDAGPIPTEVDVEEAFEPQDRGPEAEPADTPDERIVPKRTYCERCDYFERPPDVGCTHEGTEIVEMVDRRQFRVVNCPVVAEREGLADDEGDGREPELDDDEHWRGDVGPK